MTGVHFLLHFLVGASPAFLIAMNFERCVTALTNWIDKHTAA